MYFFVLELFCAKLDAFVNVEIVSRTVICKFCRICIVDGYSGENDFISFRFFRFARIEPIRFAGVDEFARDRIAYLTVLIDGAVATPVSVCVKRERKSASEPVPFPQSRLISDLCCSEGFPKDLSQCIADFERRFYANFSRLPSVSGDTCIMESARQAMYFTREEFEKKKFCDGIQGIGEVSGLCTAFWFIGIYFQYLNRVLLHRAFLLMGSLVRVFIFPLNIASCNSILFSNSSL